MSYDKVMRTIAVTVRCDEKHCPSQTTVDQTEGLAARQALHAFGWSSGEVNYGKYGGIGTEDRCPDHSDEPGWRPQRDHVPEFDPKWGDPILKKGGKTR